MLCVRTLCGGDGDVHGEAGEAEGRGQSKGDGEPAQPTQQVTLQTQRHKATKDARNLGSMLRHRLKD
jgi:hypothetical protein